MMVRLLRAHNGRLGVESGRRVAAEARSASGAGAPAATQCGNAGFHQTSPLLDASVNGR